MSNYRYPKTREDIDFQPWTKPDGTRRFRGAIPAWYCPKCLKPFQGRAAATHKTVCGKEPCSTKTS